MSAALARLCDGPGMTRAVAVRVVLAGQAGILLAGWAVAAWAGAL